MGKLSEYKRKREFSETPEPRGREGRRRGSRFVVQMHDATRLHWDLRLEVDGVLKSWAVPKGPTLDPSEKRLAVRTEDHPLEYLRFEEVIPDGQYGAGPMMVWDTGTFETPPDWPPDRSIAKGEVKFTLRGKKLRGSFVLVKIRSSNKGDKGNEWLLIKHKDEFANTKWKVEEHQVSVISGRTLGEIADGMPPADGYRQLHAAELTGARETAMPEKLLPMLSTLSDKPFSDPKWLFEIKWDGVRALTWIRNGKIEMRSRNGNVITAQYPELVNLPKHFDGDDALLDGEIVVLEEDGRSSFERLQQRMHVNAPTIGLLRHHPVVYYIFDLLYCDGFDLRETPLRERKQLLKQLLAPGGPVRFSDHQMERGKELFALAQQSGLEGIIGKHAESAYVSKRSPAWVKLKVVREVDAVVGGWTAPRNSRRHFGALSLGLHEGKTLRYVGGVGSGFDDEKLEKIFGQLKKIETKNCPFTPVPETPEPPTWVEPKFVARVKYGEWTQEKHLRHPSFVGLRNDVRPEECTMDAVVGAGLQTAPSANDESGAGKGRSKDPPLHSSAPSVVVVPALAGKVIAKEKEIEKELFSGKLENVLVELDGKRQRFSNLNKIYFPESSISKRELLAYYYRIAPRILPYLKDRPMVLRRYPNGITGEAFFQKEAGEAAPDWMETTPVPSEHHGREVPYFLCNDRSALLYLANLGCIDHNPWPSRRGHLEEPDYFFFDLDPTDDTDYDIVVTVAKAIYEKIRALGLKIFPKTSGASGFHLFLPLAPGYNYDQARTFAEIIARIVAAENPKLITMERAVTKRPKGRVLIDFVQNAFGRPLASAWSARAYPKAPVSAPLFPEEMKKGLDPSKFNIRTILARLERKGDPWADFWKKPQRLEDAMQKLSKVMKK